MKEEKFVLFDFDGVIADSLAIMYELSVRFNPELDEQSYQALFDTNIHESLTKLQGADREKRSAEYFAAFAPRVKAEARIFAGMDFVISRLADSYALAVISSTPSEIITHVLLSHDLLHYFSDILGRDVHPSKVEKMRMIFEKHQTTADQCILITDTLGDMREAKEHTMGTIGVSWGVHPKETLEKGIPFRIVDRPDELPDAIDDYFARVRD
jgi:phosphoglycolate phosphatase